MYFAAPFVNPLDLRAASREYVSLAVAPTVSRRPRIFSVLVRDRERNIYSSRAKESGDPGARRRMKAEAASFRRDIETNISEENEHSTLDRGSRG